MGVRSLIAEATGSLEMNSHCDLVKEVCQVSLHEGWKNSWMLNYLLQGTERKVQWTDLGWECWFTVASMTPVCVLDPGTRLGSNLERKKYVSKHCKCFPHCKILMNKNNLTETLKQSNREKRDIPSQLTKDPAQFGHFEAWRMSVTGPDQAGAAPPWDPGVWQKSTERHKRAVVSGWRLCLCLKLK